MNFILFLFYFSRLLSSALPLKSMYLLLLCKSMSGVLNKQFILIYDRNTEKGD